MHDAAAAAVVVGGGLSMLNSNSSAAIESGDKVMLFDFSSHSCTTHGLPGRSTLHPLEPHGWSSYACNNCRLLEWLE